MQNPAPQPAEPVIRMEEVAVGAMQDLNTLILEAVNWTVNRDDFWVVAGLQGSGKSDFILLAGGLMAPARGRYRLFGEEMPIFDEPRLKTRLRLGLVFDGGQLFNHLTVRENIALPLRYHRNLSLADAVEEVQPWLEAFELAEWADSTPGTLGRNWQQRVGLARALILQPELLLVDNPLGGLDYRHVTWWLEFLNRLGRGHALLQNRPLTLVTTTADLRPWKGVARQFAILKNRRFVVLGSWDQLEAASRELLQELLPMELTPVDERGGNG